jgi:hypothetical protein
VAVPASEPSDGMAGAMWRASGARAGERRRGRFENGERPATSAQFGVTTPCVCGAACGLGRVGAGATTHARASEGAAWLLAALALTDGKAVVSP